LETKQFDLVVIGSGPAGEKAAIEASRMRKSTAIVEKRSVQGGVCIHTGTIPSKTLRETVMYIAGLRQRSAYGLIGGVRSNITVRELMYRKDQVIQQELDVIAQNMARHRIQVLQGAGRLLDATTVEVVSDNGEIKHLKARVIVISTGTRPYRPEHVPFDEKYIYDGESILSIDTLPRTMTIVGGAR